jgi:catechol 2,3-dioxygenase-like lactoylglutathione lyase family enzyme
VTTDVILGRVTLFSANMDLASEFYNVIGFHFEKSGSWSGKYHYLDIIKHGGQDITFEIYPLSEPGLPSRPHGLTFDVRDLPRLLNKLKDMGIPILRPKNPRVHAHCTLAVVSDPDGRTVTITQHGKVRPA